MGIQIDRLSFENYRQYGTQVINFQKDEKADTYLFAFVAQNGTGKTTMLKAITWCLYGAEAPGLSSTHGDSRSLPLANVRVLEMAKEEEKVPVSVAFRFIDENKTVIEFKRTTFYLKHRNRNATQGPTKFEATIIPNDGTHNAIHQEDENAVVIVKQYFDEAIYNFYFFDGEKLTDFFKTPLKKSIYNIAQVNVLEDTIKHVDSKRSELNRKIGVKLPEVGKLMDEKENKENFIQTTEKEINSNRRNAELAQQRVKEYGEKLRGFQSVENLQKERNRLEQEQKSIEKDKEQLQKEKTAFIQEYLVLLPLYPRLKKVYTYITEKAEAGKLPPKIDRDQIKELILHPDQPCPLCGSHLTEKALQQLQEILDQNDISSKTSNFLSRMMGPLEMAIQKVMQYPVRRDAWRDRSRNLEKKLSKNQQELSEISQKITDFGGESGTADIPLLNKKYEEANNSRIKYEANGKYLESLLVSARDDLKRLEKELGEYEEKANIQSEQKAQLAVLKELSTSFCKVRDAIVNETKKEMQEQTWKAFQSMIWKKNTFGKIEIDDQYNVSLYDTHGHEMTHSASATEEMALAYAFTLSVHQVSGKNCPLVIDSPLGRVSDENRERMAKALLEVAKDKQIIMLFTPDEYSPAVANMYNKEATVQKLNLSSDESVVEGAVKYGR